MSKPTDWPKELPYIDKSVKWVGVSELRKLNARKLDGLGEQVLVININGEPLAAVISYEMLMRLIKR